MGGSLLRGLLLRFARPPVSNSSAQGPAWGALRAGGAAPRGRGSGRAAVRAALGRGRRAGVATGCCRLLPRSPGQPGPVPAAGFGRRRSPGGPSAGEAAEQGRTAGLSDPSLCGAVGSRRSYGLLPRGGFSFSLAKRGESVTRVSLARHSRTVPP